MAKINKDNIEAYLLDFIENNISDDDREELKSFLKENPQYNEMLFLYDGKLTLEKDESIVFADKSSLKRKIAVPLWKKVVYTTSSIAAALLLMFLINIPKEVNNTSAIASQSSIYPKGIIISVKEKNEAKEYKQEPLFFNSATKKEENTFSEPEYSQVQEDNIAAETEEHTMFAEVISADNANTERKEHLIITENQNSGTNDTIYIIYSGSNRNNTLERLGGFIDRHTDINILQTVSNTKENINKVKEKVNKYIEF
ncbi:MAG: hypothetical protein IJ748_00195 [Bacteroidales bacterium]|nr:hypothetical protein [Bacteroidales bacterium]